MDRIARPIRFAPFLLIVALVSGAAVAQSVTYPPPEFDPSQGYTQFAIPKAKTAPTIDGTIAPGEWEDAVYLNNMADQNKRWAFLYARWARWRVKWDADTLYLCGETQRLPKENLAVNFRDETIGGNTVMDDSVEIHVSPVGRNAIGRKLPWAAQAILNPLGVGYYNKFTWAVAARTTAWRPGWEIGSRIHEDAWVIEIAMPNDSLDLTQPNEPGDRWSMLLARNWKGGGWNQSTLAAALSGFQVPREHPAAYLTDGAYARLVNPLGLLEGRIQTDLELGAADEPQDVKVALQIEQVKPRGAGEEFQPFTWSREQTVRVEPGKLTAWSVDEAGELQEKTTYRYHLKVTSDGFDHPLLETNFFFVPGSAEWLAEAAQRVAERAKDYKFGASLAPTRNVLSVFADFIYSPDPNAVAALEVELTPADGDEPIFTARSENIHYDSITDTLQLPELTPGKYAWNARLLDGDGKTLATGSGQVEKKDEAEAFDWWNFPGGDAEKVLWPYEPVQVADGGARVDYWGGTMYLDGLCLPRQVQVTANREWRPKLLWGRPSVLADGVRVTASQDGKAAPVRMQGFPRTTDVADHEVAMRGYGLIGETVEVRSDATVGQDGLLWITLTLSPYVDNATGKDVPLEEASLDGLTIDIPYRAAEARLIAAYGEPGYGSYTLGAVPEGEGVVWDCTEVGTSVLAYGNMLPVVWVGSDRRGLVLLAENNKGWAHADKPDQQILRDDDEVVLRMNVIQEPITLTGERKISFGLLPTPMRKMVPGWRMLNTSFAQNFFDAFRGGRIPTPQTPHNASYMPVSYSKSRTMMFHDTQNMITSLGGLEYAPHTERGGYETRSADWSARNYFRPEWWRNTWTKEFQDHLLYNLQKWMDEGGLTGIYRDQFYPTPVANHVAGAAWLLPDGRVNRGYNMLLDREYNVREYALYLENGITPRVFTHTTNGGQLIAYPWVTAILDGEDNMIVSNADYDFVDVYPPDRMQAYGNPWPWGNTFYWMRLIQNGDDDWRAAQDRAYLGWCVLHDVMYCNPIHTLRPALFAWGMNDGDVKYWPYWRTGEIVSCDDPDVLVSLWTLPDRVMICAFNTDKQRGVNATITVPLRDLGLMPDVRSEYIGARDIEGGQVNFDAWNGTVKIKVGGHDFRMISIRKYTD